MTYFGFLALFLGIPIAGLLAITILDQRNGRSLPPHLSAWAPAAAIAIHVIIALLYTTPWDNYLVATRVWWYDPTLVTGITLGWVPVEEYTFFILQPILAGLWLLLLLRRSQPLQLQKSPSISQNNRFRWLTTLPVMIVWAATAVILLTGWQPGTYLALELVWALPPIALQLAFGADILRQNGRLVLLTIIPLTLYLSAADALAINWGTWTINPAQSLNLFLGGILPVEEFIFFLLTNTLITFGVILVLAQVSHQRLAALKNLVHITRNPYTVSQRNHQK
ncbi:MAG: lycopene cyclase domain-containing protein [Candidatus Thermofonsia bacterium]|nr:MAG: lycopene cyclase domain-containing protein [Candidatus Thermofonsia bacterium]